MAFYEIRHNVSGDLLYTARGLNNNTSLRLMAGAAAERAVREGVDLSGANLSGAFLSARDLRGAKLAGANLMGAAMMNAWLEDADLRGANLERANLTNVRMLHADISRVSFCGAHGANEYVKCLQIDTYPICYTAERLQIGCQNHPIEAWQRFSNQRILSMDGAPALRFWKKYKHWLFATIELCPAKPTKG